MGKHHSGRLIGWALVMCLIAVALSVVALATDHWLEIEVDRSQLTDLEKQISNQSPTLGRIYYSRDRGIMRECYPGKDVIFLDFAHDVIDGNCFFQDFNEMEGDSSNNYDTRIHLLRATIGCYVVAMLLIVIAFFLGIGVACVKSIFAASTALICAGISGILMLLAIVLFHTVEYIENNDKGFPGELMFRNTWPEKILQVTEDDYGYSYALAWAALGLVIIVCVFLGLTIRALKMEVDEESLLEPVSEKDKINSSWDYVNPATVMEGPPIQTALYDPGLYGMSKGGGSMMPIAAYGFPPTHAMRYSNFNNMTYAMPGQYAIDSKRSGSRKELEQVDDDDVGMSPIP